MYHSGTNMPLTSTQRKSLAIDHIVRQGYTDEVKYIFCSIIIQNQFAGLNSSLPRNTPNGSTVAAGKREEYR